MLKPNILDKVQVQFYELNTFEPVYKAPLGTILDTYYNDHMYENMYLIGWKTLTEEESSRIFEFSYQSKDKFPGYKYSTWVYENNLSGT